jgi:4-hydroxybenzoate polyprenyltransferase
MLLAGLYVIRVVAGGAATGIPVSNWLLVFTLFVSLSLAFLKRFIEVKEYSNAGTTRLPGRGYFADDAEWLRSVGTSSAYMSVLILALYVNSMDVMRLYNHPERLLLLCPVLLYWATRIWLQAHRRQLHHDPVVSVALDRGTYVLVVIAAAIIWAAM